ncbi:MAG TPA: type II toxin-antitoxin system VapC family toxin [Bryobacteraceae bacterium]|nr:type II toxin-antitoxin system VapC family toxin [Bryobacteraceae bacterium]
MATFLLDTSVLIDVLNGKRGRGTLLRNLIAEGHILACCPINVSEVYAGMRPREEARTTALLRSLEYFPITFSVAELAGLLKRDYGKRGRTLSLTDTTIAAVAIHHQLTLITDNTKDFPMKDLRVYSAPADLTLL